MHVYVRIPQLTLQKEKKKDKEYVPYSSTLNFQYLHVLVQCQRYTCISMIYVSLHI